jgi:hypothetical protein
VSKATRRIWQSYSDVTIKSSALMRIGAGIYTTHGARTAPNGGGGAANGIVAQQSGPVCVEEICEPLAADWPGWWFWGAERRLHQHHHAYYKLYAYAAAGCTPSTPSNRVPVLLSVW